MGVISRAVTKASNEQIDRMKPKFEQKFREVFGEDPEDDIQVEWVSDDINVGPHVAFWTEGYRFVLLPDEENPDDVQLFSYDERQFRTIKTPDQMADMVRNNEQAAKDEG